MLLRSPLSRHLASHLQLSPSCQTPHGRVVTAAAKKPKPQRKRLRKPKGPVSERIYVDYAPEGDEHEDIGSSDKSVVLVPGSKAPKAPATGDQPAVTSPRPEDLYPVFPRPQQSSVSSINDGKWSWGGDRPAPQQTAQQEVPMWNPKTGFMKTRAQIEAGQSSSSSSTADQQPTGQQAAEQAASTAIDSSHSSRDVNKSGLPPASTAAGSSSSKEQQMLVEPLPAAAPAVTPPAAAAAAAGSAVSSSSASSAALAPVGREQVLGACFTTSLGMAAAAAGLHVFAQQQSASLLGTDQAAVDQLLRIPLGLDSVSSAATMFAAAAGVTAARFALLQFWPEFAAATERSNKQVLTPLSWPDVVLVAVLTGVTEEFLFRGGLIPATLPDYRGVLLSGVVFGVLHVTGGRNVAFAGWATVVGWLYGAVFLSTANIWVAAGAHSLANLASAAVWLNDNRKAGPA